MPSRFLDEIPAELTDADEQRAPRAARRHLERSAAAHRRRPPAGAGPAATFALGDDVVHAKFGDGVVTGLEPGGLVVVRFALATAPSAS